MKFSINMKSISDNPTRPFYYNNLALTSLDKLIEVVIIGKIIWALISLVANRLLSASLAVRRISVTKSNRERLFASSRGREIGCRAVAVRLHQRFDAFQSPKETIFFASSRRHEIGFRIAVVRLRLGAPNGQPGHFASDLWTGVQSHFRTTRTQSVTLRPFLSGCWRCPKLLGRSYNRFAIYLLASVHFSWLFMFCGKLNIRWARHFHNRMDNVMGLKEFGGAT
jgi:hypothetical protein